MYSRYITKAPFSQKKNKTFQVFWLQPRSFFFPAGCTFAFDCFLLVSADTSYVFANSCHMMMYYSVSRFVYAHFIVAIFDSCCMDENNNKKNLNKTIWFAHATLSLCVFGLGGWFRSCNIETEALRFRVKNKHLKFVGHFCGSTSTVHCVEKNSN